MITKRVITEERKLYLKNYRKKNPEKFVIAQKKYTENNPNKTKEWKNLNKEKVIEHAKRGREKNKKKVNEYSRNYFRNLRMQCLQHYGGEKPSCVCCGESKIEFLALDHKNGGGNKHRILVKGNISQWIKKNNFPDVFQILCHNCNMAKGFYGECPHTVLHPTKMN